MLVFFREIGQTSIIEDVLLQGLGWPASSGRPGVVGPLLVSRSIFAGFIEAKWPKINH